MNEVPTFVIQAAAVTGIVKSVVDVIRRSPLPTPPWSIPILVIFLGIGVAFLLFVATGGDVSLQSIASSVLAGILGGAGAIASTELQKKADG